MVLSLCNKPVCVPTQKITSLSNISHHSYPMLSLFFFSLFCFTSHHSLSSDTMSFLLFLFGFFLFQKMG